jgi:hypothetical protein
MSNCQCGARMIPTNLSNSGTTQVSWVCPEIGLDPDWRPWTYGTPAGHAYVITAKPTHDPACCVIEDEYRTT